MTSVSAISAPAAVVSEWVEAFNSRDLDGMLGLLDPGVHFHPLRLVGLDGSYRGHDGVRRWFDGLQRLGHEHHIDLSGVRSAGHSQVLAAGSVRLAGQAGFAPFSALHRLVGGQIVSMHHYLSDPDLLERLGLLR